MVGGLVLGWEEQSHEIPPPPPRVAYPHGHAEGGGGSRAWERGHVVVGFYTCIYKVYIRGFFGYKLFVYVPIQILHMWRKAL